MSLVIIMRFLYQADGCASCAIHFYPPPWENRSSIPMWLILSAFSCQTWIPLLHKYEDIAIYQ